MDRNKPLTGSRGPKSKITQQPPDLFIALGQKASTSRDVETKRSVPLTKSSSSSHLQPGPSKGSCRYLLLVLNKVYIFIDRKREASSSSLQVGSSAKKLKANIPGRPQGLPSTSLLPSERVSSQPSAEPWDALVLECEAQDLFDNVMNSVHAGNVDKAVIIGRNGANIFLCRCRMF